MRAWWINVYSLEVTLAPKEISKLYELEQIAASLAGECRSKNLHKYAAVSQILFRGHSNTSLDLETTLERFGKKKLDLEEYVRYLSKVTDLYT